MKWSWQSLHGATFPRLWSGYCQWYTVLAFANTAVGLHFTGPAFSNLSTSCSNKSSIKFNNATGSPSNSPMHPSSAAAEQQPQTWEVLFSLAPGNTFPNAPSSYQSFIGLKIWDHGIKPFLMLGDMDSERIVTCCEESSQSATATRWMKIQWLHHSAANKYEW